jgi:hypothetical protein
MSYASTGSNTNDGINNRHDKEEAQQYEELTAPFAAVRDMNQKVE